MAFLLFAAVPPDSDATNPVPIRHFPNLPGNDTAQKPSCICPARSALGPPLGELLSEREAEGVSFRWC